MEKLAGYALEVNIGGVSMLRGADGKSAYQYAVEGGYTGTEAEFSTKMAVGLTTEQVNALDGMFKVCAFIKADVSEEYNAFRTAFDIEAATITGISATYSGGAVAVGTAVTDLTGIVVTANYSDGSKQTVTGYTLSGTIAEGSNTITVTYEGMTTTFTVTGVAEEVTLTSISATYSGGDVAVGTAVADLTGIVVTAQYSDGSTASVTGYTLSGTIAEGSNTITVSYGGMTTTFSVTGVAESSGNPFAGTWTEGFRLQTNGTEYATGHPTFDTTDYVDCTNFSTVTISTTKPDNLLINAVVWYDDSKTYISGDGGKYVSTSNENYSSSLSFTKVDGAAYCRICLAGYEHFNISVK